MCDFKLIRITRSISKLKSLVLLSRELYNKFTTDEAYLKVLVNDRRDELNVSKSYYYYILSQFKDVGLTVDNAISFKAVVPVIVNDFGISFDNSLIYIDEDDKLLIFIDTKSTKYKCPGCPVYAECVYGLKKVARQNDIKLGEITTVPAKLWDKVISGILKKYINNIKSIKIPIKVTDTGVLPK